MALALSRNLYNASFAKIACARVRALLHAENPHPDLSIRVDIFRCQAIGASSGPLLHEPVVSHMGLSQFASRRHFCFAPGLHTAAPVRRFQKRKLSVN